MVTVAIIDDGIGIGLYDVGNVVQSIEITTTLEVRYVDKTKLFNASHGTICAAIIKSYYQDVIFTSIKILSDKSCKGNKEQLKTALEWCILNGIQIVNLSIGTTTYSDFEMIRDIINKAYNCGLIIIAAYSNKDTITYPASCSNVIGVKCCKDGNLTEGKYAFHHYPLDGIEITACSEHLLLNNLLQKQYTKKCNSFATPMITAKVCNIIDKFPGLNLEDIKQKLYQHSINYTNDKIQINNYKNIDWITNAVMICMNETENISELPYIKVISDLQLLNDIDNTTFDTLILLDDSIKEYEKLTDSVKYLSSKTKNIVFLDNELKNNEIKFENDCIKFWCPSLIDNFYKGVLSKKGLDVPLIIVYGYKDSYILKVIKSLVSKLRNDGYYSIGAYTRPIGVLYNLEYLPISKDKNLMQIKNKIEILYRIYNFDIIILGILIDKDDILPQKININLKPDKTIFIVDFFTKEIINYFSKLNMCDSLILTTENYKENCSCEINKTFDIKNLDLFYRELLRMFTD